MCFFFKLTTYFKNLFAFMRDILLLTLMDFHVVRFLNILGVEQRGRERSKCG